MSDDTDAAVNDYIARHPLARAALLDDPMFAAQMDAMRSFLAHLESALRAEGVDQLAARRIINTVVYGTADPDPAIERMADREVMLHKLAALPASFTADEMTSLRGGEPS